jgi:two-component system response regulator FixJ
MNVRPTVFVVDDDPAVRESLRLLISESGLAVETFASAEHFLRACRPDRAGCLLLDVRMSGMSGLDLQERLRARRIPIPVVIITGYADVPMAIKAMKAGAVNFIEKPFHDGELLNSIRAGLQQSEADRSKATTRSDVLARLGQLTSREREVFELVVDGVSNKQIAFELGISRKTVEAHRAQVMQKMRARTLADLVRFAIIAQS